MPCGRCAHRHERSLMTALLIVLIILILVFGGGGYWVSRPGYAGPGAGVHNLLYILAVIVLILVVLHLLGVVSLGLLLPILRIV
jgi:hypothetical protein